jgi:hypothetical protein
VAATLPNKNGVQGSQSDLSKSVALPEPLERGEAPVYPQPATSIALHRRTRLLPLTSGRPLSLRTSEPGRRRCERERAVGRKASAVTATRGAAIE